MCRCEERGLGLLFFKISIEGNTMKKKVTLYLVVSFSMAVCLLPSSVHAQNLSECLTSSITGEEKSQIMKSVFFAIAAHPEMAPYSKISEEEREKHNKYMGSLYTRLYAEDCANVLRMMSASGNTQGIGNELNKLFVIAIQGLMNDQNVANASAAYFKYVDQEKIKAINSSQPPGQVPSYQAPPGQVPSHQAPPGQVPSHQVPSGQAPSYQQAPPGQVPSYQQAPPGQVPSYQQAPPGQAPSYQALPGQTPSYQVPTEQTPSYQAPMP
jgi:hypothetical protein